MGRKHMKDIPIVEWRKGVKYELNVMWARGKGASISHSNDTQSIQQLRDLPFDAHYVPKLLFHVPKVRKHCKVDFTTKIYTQTVG